MKVDAATLERAVAEAGDWVDFGGPENAPSEEAIAAVEAELGVRLPPSYRWWLRRYGGGEILGGEIHSIYGSNLTPADILTGYRLHVEAGHDARLIPICETDLDGVFCLDARDSPSGTEYPVLNVTLGRRFADDFSEFLLRQLTEEY